MHSVTLNPRKVLAFLAIALVVGLGFGGGEAGNASGPPGPTCPSDGNLTNTAPPVLSGSTIEGGTLSTTNGSWSFASGAPASPAFRYEWRRDGVAISGATSQTYVVTSADVDHVLYVDVFAYFACGPQGRADSNAVQIGDVGDDVGPVGSDQSPATGDDSGATPAAPVAYSASGPAAPGTYSSQTWTEEETGAAGGLSVVATTASGTFALTGVVVDEATGVPISGATVRLESDPPNTSATIITVTTNPAGAFAFINVPASTTNDLLVSAVGRAAYEIANSTYDVNETYAITAVPGAEAKYFDDAKIETVDRTLAAVPEVPDYKSETRIPPMITVGVHQNLTSKGWEDSCSASVAYHYTAVYGYRFYVLHTVWGEIKGSYWPAWNATLGTFQTGPFKGAALSANAEVASTFGWYRRVHDIDPNAGREVENTFDYQCFLPHARVPSSWHAAVEAALKQRIAGPKTADVGYPYGRIINSQFRGDPNNDCRNGINTLTTCGSYFQVSCTLNSGTFTDPNWPNNDSVFSQLGSKKAAEYCGASWPTIVNYFYRNAILETNGQVLRRLATVKVGLVPTPPTISCNNSTAGRISFHFASTQNHVQVGWTYVLEHKLPGGAWRVLVRTGFNWRLPRDQRDVTKDYIFNTTTSQSYRVYATNPVGSSAIVYYNNGNAFAPLTAAACP